jgi:hypothetical protein
MSTSVYSVSPQSVLVLTVVLTVTLHGLQCSQQLAVSAVYKDLSLE